MERLPRGEAGWWGIAFDVLAPDMSRVAHEGFLCKWMAEQASEVTFVGLMAGCCESSASLWAYERARWRHMVLTRRQLV